MRISKAARIQLAIIGALYLAVQAISIWLDQYATMASSSTTNCWSAGQTPTSGLIPVGRSSPARRRSSRILFIVTAFNGRWRFPIIGTALLLVMGLLIGSVYPWFVQKFQVDPSAKTAEALYIQRNIDATRDAYGVADVKEAPYTAETKTEPGALRNDAERRRTSASSTRRWSRVVRAARADRAVLPVRATLDVDRYTDRRQDPGRGRRRARAGTVRLGVPTDW